MEEQKWEYGVMPLPCRDNYPEEYSTEFAEDIEKELNEWGEAGFELVTIYKGCAIFKQPLIQKEEATRAG